MQGHLVSELTWSEKVPISRNFWVMPCEVAVVARVFTPNGRKKDCLSTCNSTSAWHQTRCLRCRNDRKWAPCAMATYIIFEMRLKVA